MIKKVFFMFTHWLDTIITFVLLFQQTSFSASQPVYRQYTDHYQAYEYEQFCVNVLNKKK